MSGAKITAYREGDYFTFDVGSACADGAGLFVLARIGGAVCEAGRFSHPVPLINRGPQTLRASSLYIGAERSRATADAADAGEIVPIDDGAFDERNNHRRDARHGSDAVVLNRFEEQFESEPRKCDERAAIAESGEQ
jgi:hypothetical protein